MQTLVVTGQGNQYCLRHRSSTYTNPEDRPCRFQSRFRSKAHLRRPSNPEGNTCCSLYGSSVPRAQQRRQPSLSARAQFNKSRRQQSNTVPAEPSRLDMADTQQRISFIIICTLAVVGAAAQPSLAQVTKPVPKAFVLADIDPRTAGLLAVVSRPILALGIFLMLVRIVLSWYPNIRGDKLPWSAAVFPTEFFLGPTRRAVPPVGGVDVAPIIWLALLTFLNEILLGPQGILNLLQRKLEL